MKLAALGVVTIGAGIAWTVPGLIGIGAFWVLMGLLARAYRNRIAPPVPSTPTGTPTGTSPGTPLGALATDGRSFALGTLLWLAIGIPSVLVGVLELGIATQDSDWRWLPLAVGALALVIGVLGAVLYGTGSAITAVEGVPDKPATVWIRRSSETGTFVNERPRLELELHVEPEASTGLAPYDVTKKATVPFTAIGSLRVGDGFRAVVVGPDKPASMQIDWDAPVSAGTTVDVGTRLEELDRLRQQASITDEEYQAQRQRILDTL